MALTLSGTNGVVGAGFTVDASGVSVTAGVGTFSSIGAGASVSAAGLTGALPTISAANCTNIPAANITGTLPAISGANLTGISGGIPFGQIWVLTTGFHPPDTSNNVFNANLAVRSGDGYGTMGSETMTESSGVFTFPSTGVYRIEAYGLFRESSNVSTNAELDIQATTDGSSFTRSCLIATNLQQNHYYVLHGCLQLDVTNTSTHKVRFVYQGTTSLYIHANSQADQQTYFVFTKLGET